MIQLKLDRIKWSAALIGAALFLSGFALGAWWL